MSVNTPTTVADVITDSTYFKLLKGGLIHKAPFGDSETVKLPDSQTGAMLTQKFANGSAITYGILRHSDWIIVTDRYGNDKPIRNYSAMRQLTELQGKGLFELLNNLANGVAATPAATPVATPVAVPGVTKGNSVSTVRATNPAQNSADNSELLNRLIAIRNSGGDVNSALMGAVQDGTINFAIAAELQSAIAAIPMPEERAAETELPVYGAGDVIRIRLNDGSVVERQLSNDCKRLNSTIVP